jgi:hypothetical protein
MRNKTVVTIPFAALVLLGGCADPSLGRNSRTGWVTEFYTAERLAADRPACLANLSDVDIASQRYALFRYYYLRSYKHISVLVPDSIEVHLHDKVEISPPSCENGALPKVIQVLKHSAQIDR